MVKGKVRQAAGDGGGAVRQTSHVKIDRATDWRTHEMTNRTRKNMSMGTHTPSNKDEKGMSVKLTGNCRSLIPSSSGKWKPHFRYGCQFQNL